MERLLKHISPKEKCFIAKYQWMFYSLIIHDDAWSKIIPSEQNEQGTSIMTVIKMKHRDLNYCWISAPYKSRHPSHSPSSSQEGGLNHMCTPGLKTVISHVIHVFNKENFNSFYGTVANLFRQWLKKRLYKREPWWEA